jgi:hypothetical protein
MGVVFLKLIRSCPRYPVTKDSREQLLAERLRALATVILTRRGDLIIVDTKRDTGLDLHVSIDREDKSMRLTFGVLLRGLPTSVTIEQANRALSPTIAQFQGMRKFTYPVCLFVFITRDDQALFSWLAEPVVTGGAPKLVHHTKAHCVPLTDELLGQVVDQVIAWYDVVEAVLIA